MSYDKERLKQIMDELSATDEDIKELLMNYRTMNDVESLGLALLVCIERVYGELLHLHDSSHELIEHKENMDYALYLLTCVIDSHCHDEKGNVYINKDRAKDSKRSIAKIVKEEH